MSIKCYFYIKDGYQNDVHKLVKKYNLRYNSNPMKIFNEWSFNVETDNIDDYENFSGEIDKIKQTYITKKKKKSLFQKILSFFFKKDYLK